MPPGTAPPLLFLPASHCPPHSPPLSPHPGPCGVTLPVSIWALWRAKTSSRVGLSTRKEEEEGAGKTRGNLRPFSPLFGHLLHCSLGKLPGLRIQILLGKGRPFSVSTFPHSLIKPSGGSCKGQMSAIHMTIPQWGEEKSAINWKMCHKKEQLGSTRANKVPCVSGLCNKVIKNL